jgi:hypothetical protein
MITKNSKINLLNLIIINYENKILDDLFLYSLFLFEFYLFKKKFRI